MSAESIQSKRPLVASTPEEITAAVLFATGKQGLTEGMLSISTYFVEDEAAQKRHAGDPMYPGYKSFEVVAYRTGGENPVLRRASFTPEQVNDAVLAYREEMQPTLEKAYDVQARIGTLTDYALQGASLNTWPTGVIDPKLVEIHSKIDGDERQMKRFRAILQWAKGAFPTEVDVTISQETLQRRIIVLGFLVNSQEDTYFSGMRDIVLSGLSDEEFGELMTQVKHDALSPQLLAIDDIGDAARRKFRQEHTPSTPIIASLGNRGTRRNV